MIAVIEGGEFRSVMNGDDKDETIAHISLPYGFGISNRRLVVFEVEEVKAIERLISMNMVQCLNHI